MVNKWIMVTNHTDAFAFMHMRPLFHSVSQSDPLQFWANHGLDYRGVANFLDFDADDLSKLSGVKKASVRLDEKIPKKLSERLAQIANICSLVADYFNADSAKTALWFLLCTQPVRVI